MIDGKEPRVGAYRIERLLGRGGMGEVYLAWDERLERRVALKRIRGDSTPDGRLRLRREARAAARLSHSSIVQVHDILEDGSGDCIVLEYVEGRTLASVLAAGLPETGLALRLAREIAEGLAHAHAQGLLHRDLKAQNVIVTPAGHAKILDFGLAKPIRMDDEETLTAHGAVLGTFHSMSPEQALGRDLDERSDLFALGVLLHELLTGRSPFKAPTATETLDRVLHHEPPSLAALRPDLPPELSELAARLLAKDRDLRPRQALEVVRILERAATPTAQPIADTGLSELPTSAPRQPTATRGHPLRRRAITLILIAGLAVAAAFLLLDGLRTAPLRVVVPSPAVAGPADDLDLVASGVLSSALGTLSSLEGIAPLEPSQLGVTGSSPMELARSSAADEVLLAGVAREGEMARVSLKWVQGSDGRVLWAQTFQVPAGPRDLALMADAVQVHLRQAWPDHAPRPGTPDLEARNEDYRAFLEVKRRVDSGRTTWEPELERIEGIARTSPRFLEAWLLGSRVALTSSRGAARAPTSTAPGGWSARREAWRPTIPGRSSRPSATPSLRSTGKKRRRSWRSSNGCFRPTRSCSSCAPAWPSRRAGRARRSISCAPRWSAPPRGRTSTGSPTWSPGTAAAPTPAGTSGSCSTALRTTSSPWRSSPAWSSSPATSGRPSGSTSASWLSRRSAATTPTSASPASSSDGTGRPWPPIAGPWRSIPTTSSRSSTWPTPSPPSATNRRRSASTAASSRVSRAVRPRRSRWTA